MKNKKSAFTLMEIVLTLFIIGVIMVIFMGVVKIKKTDRYIYKLRATLYNIEKVMESLLTDRRNEGHWSLDNVVLDVCKHFEDKVNTKGTIKCVKNDKKFKAICDIFSVEEGDLDINCNNNGAFIMANGVAISGFSGNWIIPNSLSTIKHQYKDITVSISDKNYTVRIFKDEPIVIPLAAVNEPERNIFGYNIEVANLKADQKRNLVKYRVVQTKKYENNAYIDTYKVYDDTKNGVSYGHAACITGVADEFITSSEKGNILNCPVVVSSVCKRYYDCKIQIMDIPSSASITFGRK